jgi:hypothetical protein
MNAGIVRARQARTASDTEKDTVIRAFGDADTSREGGNQVQDM